MRPAVGSAISWWQYAALGVLLPGWLVTASPAVNVALQASFDSAPYLVELLESAAEENSTSYFPLLDRIADGAFEDAGTEKELYDRFLQVVSDDGHLRTPEALSSFKLSLAVRSSAPRIEAHYQFYNTSVQQSLMAAQDAACPVWVHFDGKQYCSAAMERPQQDVLGEMEPRELPFDQVLGDTSLPPAFLYADVSSPMFKDFHETLSYLAKQGQISYRVRYRPPQHWTSRPLFVSGYGVELALKRTDYIVIDDRDAEQREDKNAKDRAPTDPEELKEEAPDDLRPLAASEVTKLGLSSAGYVMDNADPLDTLVKLTQNFPKYSSMVAAHNASEELQAEIRANRGRKLPPGYNGMWVNGLQIDSRETDAFSLLDLLRRERKLIEKFRGLGISAQEAVKILSHQIIGEARIQEDSQRFDYRDHLEGGQVIIWLNDIENDPVYESWSSDLERFSFAFPGQLPPVKRDLHNVIVPVDLSKPEDMMVVSRQIYTIIQRMIPVRFGLVPTTSSPESIAQLKVAHYLHETYGLASLVQYLQEAASSSKSSLPDKSGFLSATNEREPLTDKEAIPLEEVLKSEKYHARVPTTTAYQRRLSLTGETPHSLVNGVPVARGDSWIQDLSMQIGSDLKLVQHGIAENLFEEDAWLPEFFLAGAFERHNTLIMPEDPSNVRIVDLASVFGSDDILNNIPRVASDQSVLDSAHVIVVGDFETEEGLKLLSDALALRKEHGEVDLLFLHNPSASDDGRRPSEHLVGIHRSLLKGEDIDQILAHIGAADNNGDQVSEEEIQELSTIQELQQRLAAQLGFGPGVEGLVANGRAVGPIEKDSTLSVEDLNQLVAYERIKRIDVAALVVKNLGLESKLSKPLDLAKLSSLVALSMISDVPEGIFDNTPDYRIDVSERWHTKHSVITVSNSEDPAINVVAILDPASEIAQKWLPVLKVMSELAGVQLKILLNPKEAIKELPIKRFYRYVLESEPSFNGDGSLSRPQASFSGVPVEALLTLGMDVPSPWLVAPKESVHDLDNIKLNSLKTESNVDAIYALEHILIEGHSRDVTTKGPPRGVQLVLGTENHPEYADTIIMANIGYFQFKAQPGLWQINLKPGSSEKVFNIDSVGGLGYQPQPGDDNAEVALLSFQGRTLFPRLSRKPGHEEDDVLEEGPERGTTMDYVSKGLNFASGVLSSVGLNTKAGGEQHADINIFSVASGHLYERMLNIMMVSVMRHTKHTVKFWFIEQFLSPSFRAFLPQLAAEYGFSYEMVTYKWPHWLRSQREKQREIWGYKILFLDVLFPLSLDKVIFVDADQIVRTDLYDLVTHDLEGAPYGFTPMGDSRVEMEGFRFWKQGYWKDFLRGHPYHISALYVVDLTRFRALAAGDRLRGQYQMLSADPHSLSNLDQDLPNHMQHNIPIHSLPQEWLWCETWCADADLASARTIDLCNNPQTKEPKLARARRQVPEWTVYDDEIAALAKRVAREQEVRFVQSGEDPEGQGEEVQEPVTETEEKEETQETEHDRKDEL
ncbi:hypothetical protein NUU61_004986 [Penicillium alfredii]|uniref:UDP-glucose:glycoprotein glucosyltransferase n=1 Tax=Penicillium alfredii TaxID=1506179 RepID=A0A9W9F8J8_9EURO|nr:uncharacterized protein NUU61_004986 [Penicillium alfredii]KAJ5095630.1 hypothetical protein NUU61_004986 [Penicillium alfredii]